MLRSPWAECLTVRSSLHVLLLSKSGDDKPVLGLGFAGQMFIPATDSVLRCKAKMRLGGKLREITLHFMDGVFPDACVTGGGDFVAELANNNEVMISFPLKQGGYLGFRYSLRDYNEALAEAQEWRADKTGAQELLQELNDRQIKRLGNPGEDALNLAWCGMTDEEREQRFDMLK